jgi:tetratricopeptide (TPR) repeat protein
VTVVLSAVVLLVGADAFAQRGSLRGKLVGEDGQPVEGVVCSVALDGGRTYTSKTKKDGTFVRGGLRPGIYTITCEKEGYRPLPLQTQVSGFDQADLGEHVFYRLQPGELSAAEAERANELLKQFNLSADSGDNEATLKALLELDKMMPDNAEVNFNIAGTYEKMGDDDKALEHYKKAAELKPEFFDAWLSVADIYGKRKEWADAEANMKKALDLKADPVVAFNYSVYAQNAGDTAAAKEGYEKVVELDPNQALAYYQLGLIAVNEGENATAIAHFEKFLELEPNHPQAEAAKGVIEALKAKGGGL